MRCLRYREYSYISWPVNNSIKECFSPAEETIQKSCADQSVHVSCDLSVPARCMPRPDLRRVVLPLCPKQKVLETYLPSAWNLSWIPWSLITVSFSWSLIHFHEQKVVTPTTTICCLVFFSSWSPANRYKLIWSVLSWIITLWVWCVPNVCFGNGCPSPTSSHTWQKTKVWKKIIEVHKDYKVSTTKANLWDFIKCQSFEEDYNVSAIEDSHRNFNSCDKGGSSK